MEELWEKGEAGEDFDSSPRIIEPDHFQCMFLIMGFMFSLWLFVLLLDILTNSRLGFFKLMLGGLLACALVTTVNIYFFSTSLWSPITVEKKTVFRKVELFMGEYEYDKETFIKNETYCLAILGYGAVTSFIFIFVAMMRSLGKTHFLLIIYI